MEQSKEEHDPVERLPPDVVPAGGDEGEVHPLDPGADQVHHVEVDEHQEEQGDARDAHEEPGPDFEG